MALQVWLPLNGNLNNYGLNQSVVIASNVSTNTFVDGKIGQCISDNGSQFWRISGITLGSEASIACWTKTSTNGKMSWVLECNASNYLNLYEYSIYTLNIGDGNDNPFRNNGNNIYCLHDGKWHHFVVTFDSANAKLYIDGSYAGTAITYRAPTCTNRAIKLAGDFASSNNYNWNGMLNDFRVYDHCLSQKEVHEISKGLLVHYPLNDASFEETTNLVTSLSAGGQTTITDGRIVTTSGTNADTYFTINLSESIVVGTQYTISCFCEFPTGTYWDFPIGSQSNTSLTWRLYPGYNTYTFTANDAISWGSNRIFMDDLTGSARTSGVQCKMYNFQVEKKDHATAYVEGSRGFRYDPNVYTEPDGSKWARIVHHNNPASYLFSSSNNFANGVYIDENRWFNVYSVVNRLKSYEFMVKQKLTSDASEVKFRWIQYKSPLTATYNDVKPGTITKITTSGYTDGGNTGGLYILNSNTHMVIANTSNGNWYGAFGCWTSWGDGTRTGIPGHPGPGQAISTGYMDLYVRVDAIELPKVYDMSGYERHGEPLNMEYSSDTGGKYRNSVKSPVSPTQGLFRGYVNIPPMDQITFNWWAKYTVWGHQNSGLFSTSSRLDGPYDYTTTAANHRDYGFDTCNTSNNVVRISANFSIDSKWHMYTLKYDDYALKFYIDTVQQSSASQTGQLKAFEYLYLFWSYAGGANRVCQGNCSDFRIYATALSDSDIVSLFNKAATIDYNKAMYSYDYYETSNAKVNIKRNGVTEFSSISEPDSIANVSFNKNGLIKADKIYEI